MHDKNRSEIQNMMRIAIMAIITIISGRINAYHVVAVKVVMLAKILAAVAGSIHAEALVVVDAIDLEIAPRTDHDVAIMTISLPEIINHRDATKIRARESIGPGLDLDLDRDVVDRSG